MVVVRMRVDDVANGLVGHGLADGLVGGQRSRLARRTLEHHDVIRELHGEAARICRVDRPQPLAHLLHRCRHRWRRRRRCDIGRHVERDRSVRLHVVDGDVERVKPVLLLDDVPRKLDATEVGVIRIRDLHRNVADDRVRGQVFDALDQILIVERHLDVSVLDLECDDVAFAVALAARAALITP